MCSETNSRSLVENLNILYFLRWFYHISPQKCIDNTELWVASCNRNPSQHVDAFWCSLQQMAFENIVKKVEIAHFSFLLSPMFSTVFNYCSFKFRREFSKFCLNVFKVICCRFVVCGKGLSLHRFRWLLTWLTQTTFKNIIGKRSNCSL